MRAFIVIIPREAKEKKKKAESATKQSESAVLRYVFPAPKAFDVPREIDTINAHKLCC